MSAPCSTPRHATTAWSRSSAAASPTTPSSSTPAKCGPCVCSPTPGSCPSSAIRGTPDSHYSRSRRETGVTVAAERGPTGGLSGTRVQKLHLVGFTTEHDGLVFSARKGSKAGGYIVALDKELLSTIAEAERLRNGERGEGDGAAPRVRQASRLTPREIQAHLRAGRSIPEVAAEAGVDQDWVERFAVPVVAEQAQMVERARAMTYSKARLGHSTQPLGTSVRWNLADKGVAIGEDAFELGWSAFQLQDEVWMIRFRYTSRTRLQVAEWELDLDANQLLSRNRLASELGYVEKGRRPPALPAPPPRPAVAAPVRVVEEVVEQPAAPAGPPVANPVRRRRRTTPRRKPTAKKKATPKKSTVKKPTARKSKAARKSKTARKPTARKSRTATQSTAQKRARAKKAPAKK